MAKIELDPGFFMNVEVADYLWPWQKSKPVVLQHGFARSAAEWIRWVPTLAAKHRVYRPDMRGSGLSDKPSPGTSYPAELLEADMIKMLDALGLEQVHWVGESMGGPLGAGIAISHPERIASLTLIDSPLKVVTKDAQVIGEQGASSAILKYGTEEWCRRSIDHRLDPKRATPELQHWFCEIMGQTPAHVAAALYDDCVQFIDLEPMLESVHCPVLVLYGDATSGANPGEQQILRAKLRNAEFSVFRDYGHGLQVLTPEKCAAAVAQFLDRIDAAGP